jgi:polar amino acid transport system permease protein
MASHVRVPDAGATKPRHEPIKAIPVRHTGQWISAALVIAVVALLAYSVATNESIQWPVVGRNLFDSTILQGMVVTIQLTVLSMVLGIVLGIVLAVMRLSKNPVLSTVSSAYLWLFRGTPVLVQIVLWFNLALIFPRIGFGPISADTNALITPFGAALLALALNEAAYMAEIVRGGIQSVDPGQSEAAHALGMKQGQTMRRIVLPQAMRVIIPPTGNELITMIKTTSLVAVIGASDLFTRAQAIGSRDFTTFELLLVASFWYLVLTSVSTYGQSHIERRFARGTTRGSAPTNLQRILANLRPGRVSSTSGGDAR